MIPRADVTAWGANAAWPNREQIEQDLLLSRILVEIYNDEFLSEQLMFRGGTCLHKLYLPTARRYSEDLDFVRTETGPIGPVTRALTDLGTSLGFEVTTRISAQPKVYLRTTAESDREGFVPDSEGAVPGWPSAAGTVDRIADHEVLGRAALISIFREGHRNRRSPEGDSSVVAGNLVCLPPARPRSKHRARRFPSDTAPTELAQDEVLGDLVRNTAPDQRDPGDQVVVSDEQHLPIVRLRPVVVEVAVAELAMFRDVPPVELGEVMSVEFQQPTDQGLRRLGGTLHCYPRRSSLLAARAQRVVGFQHEVVVRHSCHCANAEA